MNPPKIIFLTLIAILLLFSGCFSSWQEDTGTIILNFGSSRGMAFPPEDKDLDELKYEVTFTGVNDEFTLDSEGREQVKATVIPGEWKITVKAYYEYIDAAKPSATLERVEYAFGRETVRVKPGQSNPVTVKMSNMGEVEINIVRVMKDYQVKGYKFEIQFVFEDGNQLIYDYFDKGPHLVPLKKGIWKIWVINPVIKIGDDLFYGYFDGAIINGDVDDNGDYIKYNTYDPYITVINPGDHKVLYIEITD